jgi:hypothetical protein
VEGSVWGDKYWSVPWETVKATGFVLLQEFTDTIDTVDCKLKQRIQELKTCWFEKHGDRLDWRVGSEYGRICVRERVVVGVAPLSLTSLLITVKSGAASEWEPADGIKEKRWKRSDAK